MAPNRDLLDAAIAAAFADAEIERIDCGGFACTYRLRTSEIDAAVKVLDPELVAPREGREAKALAAVGSLYVVRFLAADEVEVDGVMVPYLAMEFVEGESLQARIERGAWPSLAELVELAIKLSEGLRAIWAADLAHRDIKPGNILIRENGDPVIVDLGIARHLTLETVTVPPSPGTPGWMAPEQVDLERPARGDWRSDQFSFGLLLYLLATRYYPYRGNRLELWRAPATQEPQRPESANPDVPIELADVIRQLMARQPYERFLRPERITEELENVQAVLDRRPPATARPPAAFYLVQGDRKNFATAEFYGALAPEAVIMDARNMNDERLGELVDQARAAGSGAMIDPVSYFDRSPLDARPAGYRSLPYGARADRLLGFYDDDERRDYVHAILGYQRVRETTALIAPYFYAARAERDWLEESVRMHRIAADLAAEEGEDRPVWGAVAVAQDYLRVAEAREEFLNVVTSDLPAALYLLVHTTQLSFAPLADQELLAGMRRVIQVLADAGVPVIAGRRNSCGLLLLALGAAGFSIGARAIHQNFQPHPERPDTDGGPGADWIYIPKLLNSIKVETRGGLVDAGAAALIACDCPYCAELFGADPGAAIATTDERILMTRHNLFALRSQATELAALAPSDRLQLMRSWAEEALATYNQLAAPWAPGEGQAFLTAWLALL
jgi:tRNA A-37 threonylcarbamoyl transferase component Bud32